MPETPNPDLILARHEAGLFEEARKIMADLQCEHRSETFNRAILPLCQPLVEAIGHRMAYDAAVVPQSNDEVGNRPRQGDIMALNEYRQVSMAATYEDTGNVRRG